MRFYKKTIFKLLFYCSFLNLLSIPYSCQSKTGNNNLHNKKDINKVPQEINVRKVTFFIENSGSMKGYVNGSTTYIDVLTDLANHPRLIEKGINRYFYLTSGNGSPVRVLKLSQELKLERFNQGHSDLNNLFKVALDSTQNNSVSILISDGIYDMCPNSNPLMMLTVLGHDLREIFINKINNNDFQTILIKLKSNFNGRYSPGNCCPSYLINEERPFYIWIFGSTEILKEFFSDEYFRKLNGYVSSARFFKYSASPISYKPVSHRLLGSYRPSKNNDTTLEKVRISTAGVFQFSIAVDFSNLPLNDEYIRDIINYECSNGFSIVSIDSPTQLASIAFPSVTHLLVVKKTGNPLGTLTVSLLNKGFNWIDNTSIDDDCVIRGRNSQTFGFQVLNQGIIDAYQHFNNSKEIASFTINLKN